MIRRHVPNTEKYERAFLMDREAGELYASIRTLTVCSLEVDSTRGQSLLSLLLVDVPTRIKRRSLAAIITSSYTDDCHSLDL